MDTKIPAESLKKTICYYYLLAYCPPERVKELKEAAQLLREDIAKQSGMKVTETFNKAAPEVAHHIVAFHQNTRDPDEEWVEELTARISVADESPEKALAFQVMLGLVSRLPQRAKPDNRLHHRRGCQFCAAPCHYGYFSLVSEPRLDELKNLIKLAACRRSRFHVQNLGFWLFLRAFLPQNSRFSGKKTGVLDFSDSLLELGKSPEYMKPISAVKSFALTHIEELLGINRGAILIHNEQLANLSYCLLALATAKSRLPVPEKQFQLFQAANQNITLARV